jgi:hypothetical protein
LRAAIQEGLAIGQPHTVHLSAGLYLLTLDGPDEDASATGDLDLIVRRTVSCGAGCSQIVEEPWALEGEGLETTIIDGQGRDRVLDTFAGGGYTTRVVVQDITVRNGSPEGIRFAGATFITRALITQNAGSGIVSRGYSDPPNSLSMEDAQVTANEGRGITATAYSVNLDGCLVADNEGGGLSIVGVPGFHILNTAIIRNTAPSCAGVDT